MKHIKRVEQIKCKDKEHFIKYFNQVISKGGEGIMLREPLSPYKSGRSMSLRRYKEYLDTEVLIKEKIQSGLKCEQ